MSKKLTIIIPSFNHGVYIRDAILNAMTLSDIADIVVIDDSSSDETQEILRSLEYPNVKIIIKRENKGLLHSHRMWQEFVKTEYVYLIASDDVLIVKEFRKAFRQVLEMKNVDVAIFGGVNFYENKEWPLYTKKHEQFFKLSYERKKIEIFTNHPAPLLAQSTIFKTKLLAEIDAFDGKVKFDDYPIYIKIFQNGIKYNILFDNKISIVKYRHHQDNTYKDYNKMFDMFKEVYDFYCSDVENRTEAIALSWWLYVFRAMRDRRWSALNSIFRKGKLSYLKYLKKFLMRRISE